MLWNDDKPGTIERVLRRIPDGVLMRTLLYGLTGACLVVLTLDLRELNEQGHFGWPGADRLEPMPMAPPAKDDQVRPYLPRTVPVHPGRDGRVSLPGYEIPSAADIMQIAMSFRVGEDGAASAVGRIETGTADTFEQFLIANPGITSLTIHSGGGSVSDALQIARLIREKQIATVVPANGYCASSCPLMMAAGVKRRAGEGAWIGVHQVYSAASVIGTLQEGMAGAQEISAICQEHLIEMGVDPKVWIHAMATPKEQLYVFTAEELEELKLVTAEEETAEAG